MDNLPYSATPYAAGFELAQADADAEELRAQAAAAQRFAGAAQQVGQQVLRGPVGGVEQLAAAASALPSTAAAPAAPAVPPVAQAFEEPEPVDPRTSVMLKYTAPGVSVATGGPVIPSMGEEIRPSPIEGFGERMETTPLSLPQQQQDLGALTEQLTGTIPMVGARRVRLDADVERGVGQQERALQSLGAEYAAMEEDIRRGERQYIKSSQMYRKGLGELAARGEAMRGTRGVERQIEAQQMAGAQMAFDANRVYQDLSQSPLQTGMLAVTAGIVQGLQGYAGQDKPNAILAAVQEAAQRDVANQVEQYRRMQAGQQVSRNNFIEARQALQDDQQALQVTAMATLDQINKGLDFMKARLLRAKERADIDVVQGKLRAEIGLEKTKLDSQAASRELDAAKSNQDAYARIASARQAAAMKMAEMDAASRKKAEDHVGAFVTTEKGGAWSNALSGVTQFYQLLSREAQAGKTPEQLRGLIAADTMQVIREAFTAARQGTGTAAAAQQAFDKVMADGIAKMQTPEKREVMQAIANVYNAYVREQAGKSQTASELVGVIKRVDPSNPDAVYRFVGEILRDVDDQYKTVRAASPSAAPVWDVTYGTRINVAKEINNQLVDSFANQQRLVKPRPAVRQ